MTTGWMVGNEYFKNKHIAIEKAHCNLSMAYRTYWYDHEWDQHDWLVEPTESLADLERAHCRWLRDTYPILVLAYSGGVDSHTILHRFIEQGIHLDYIITTYQPGGIAADYNTEFLIAIKYIQSISHLLPGTKFLSNNHSLDIKKYFGNSFLNHQNNFEEINSLLRFHDAGYSRRLALHHPDVYDKVKTQNGAIIIGSNKPQIVQDSDGYWCVFTDKSEENITDDVEFFWTGSNVPLQIKQCHMAKSWMKLHNCTDSNKIFHSTNKNLFMDFNRSFGRLDPMHEIFGIKNCFGEKTKGLMKQTYGINNSFFARVLQEAETQKNIRNIHKELHLRALEAPRFYSTVDDSIYGWFTKARYLGT